MGNEESEQRAYVEDFIRRFDGEPKCDALATFMRALPVGTAHNIARVMMAYQLRTTSPIWITFAITIELLGRLEAAGRDIPSAVRDELVALEPQAASVAASARAIGTERIKIDAQLVAFGTRSQELLEAGSAYGTAVRDAEGRYLDAMRTTLDQLSKGHLATVEKRLSDAMKRTSGEIVVPIRSVWGAAALAAVVAAGLSSFFLGDAKGRHDGEDRAYVSAATIVKDGLAHRDRNVRAFAQNESRRLRLPP